MRSYTTLLLGTAIVATCGRSDAGRDERAPAVARRAAAESVLAHIDSQGASVALENMFTHHEREAAFMDSIATGDSLWLHVAVRLKPASDAGSSMGLELALATALPKAPARVLAIVVDSTRGFRLDTVCGEPAFDLPDSVLAAHRARALAALASVAETSLAGIRDACAREFNTGFWTRLPAAQQGVGADKRR